MTPVTVDNAAIRIISFGMDRQGTWELSENHTIIGADNCTGLFIQRCTFIHCRTNEIIRTIATNLTISESKFISNTVSNNMIHSETIFTDQVFHLINSLFSNCTSINGGNAIFFHGCNADVSQCIFDDFTTSTSIIECVIDSEA